MASYTFRFTARWKEELVVIGPGGSFILELPMGVLTAYLPTEQAWPMVAPDWALHLWPLLKAELEQWCIANGAELQIDPGATVIPFYEVATPPNGRTIHVVGCLAVAVLLIAAAWLVLV
jgi:hypothetical protein